MAVHSGRCGACDHRRHRNLEVVVLTEEDQITRGYKVFNPNWTSKHGDTVYELGQTYELPKVCKIVPCGYGYHFCINAADCFNYYAFNVLNHVCVVEAYGEFVTENDKSCAYKIKIVEELTWGEVHKVANSGTGASIRKKDNVLTLGFGTPYIATFCPFCGVIQ